MKVRWWVGEGGASVVAALPAERRSCRCVPLDGTLTLQGFSGLVGRQREVAVCLS